jgi:hypothetical protein
LVWGLDVLAGTQGGWAKREAKTACGIDKHANGDTDVVRGTEGDVGAAHSAVWSIGATRGMGWVDGATRGMTTVPEVPTIQKG